MAKLTRLAGACEDGAACAAVFLTEQGEVIVRGNPVTDPVVLAALDLVANETAVQVPLDVLMIAARPAEEPPHG